MYTKIASVKPLCHVLWDRSGGGLITARAVRCTIRALFAVAGMLVAHVAHAQVISTADTLGKEKTAILVSDNQLYAGDGIQLNLAYVMVARGVSERLDLFGSVGETATGGEVQASIAGGGNLHLAKVRGVSVSTFNIASVPLHRRDEACLVLLNSALIASRSLGLKVVVYSGLNALIPIGERSRGVFTPPSTKLNVPLGVTYAVRSWGLWAELDVGNLNAIGVGLSRVF